MSEFDKFLEVEHESDYERDLQNEKFEVDNDSKADWCLKRIKKIDDDYKRVDDLLQKQASEIKLKREQLKRLRDYEAQVFIDFLEEYARECDLEMKPAKTQESYKLTKGSIIYKYPKTNLVPDREVLLESVKKVEGLEEYVEQKENLKWGEFKKRLQAVSGLIVDKETGQVLELEGLDIEEVPGEYTVKIND